MIGTTYFPYYRINVDQVTHNNAALDCIIFLCKGQKRPKFVVHIIVKVRIELCNCNIVPYQVMMEKKDYTTATTPLILIFDNPIIPQDFGYLFLNHFSPAKVTLHDAKKGQNKYQIFNARMT